MDMPCDHFITREPGWKEDDVPIASIDVSRDAEEVLKQLVLLAAGGTKSKAWLFADKEYDKEEKKVIKGRRDSFVGLDLKSPPHIGPLIPPAAAESALDQLDFWLADQTQPLLNGDGDESPATRHNNNPARHRRPAPPSSAPTPPSSPSLAPTVTVPFLKEHVAHGPPMFFADAPDTRVQFAITRPIALGAALNLPFELRAIKFTVLPPPPLIPWAATTETFPAPTGQQKRKSHALSDDTDQDKGFVSKKRAKIQRKKFTFPNAETIQSIITQICIDFPNIGIKHNDRIMHGGRCIRSGFWKIMSLKDWLRFMKWLKVKCQMQFPRVPWNIKEAYFLQQIITSLVQAIFPFALQSYELALYIATFHELGWLDPTMVAESIDAATIRKRLMALRNEKWDDYQRAYLRTDSQLQGWALLPLPKFCLKYLKHCKNH